MQLVRYNRPTQKNNKYVKVRCRVRIAKFKNQEFQLWLNLLKLMNISEYLNSTYNQIMTVTMKMMKIINLKIINQIKKSKKKVVKCSILIIKEIKIKVNFQKNLTMTQKINNLVCQRFQLIYYKSILLCFNKHKKKVIYNSDKIKRVQIINQLVIINY